MFGAGLTIFVVYVFLNSWRSTLITALSLPTSVIAAFIAVWLCGFTLNFMSLLGLSLAIGVLIDDAIVVRENIVRHMERGADRAHRGARTAPPRSAWRWRRPPSRSSRCSCRWPSCPASSGEWFRPFALTVVASVLVSLFISLHARPDAVGLLGRPAGPPQAAEAAASAGCWQRFNDWFDHQADRYGHVIAWALHHRAWMALFAVASLVGAIALQVKFGGSQLPAGVRRRHDRDRRAHAVVAAASNTRG